MRKLRTKHKKGYILIYRPDHPRAHYNGYILEHRLVAEEKLGRYLESHEIVHHINELKDDNRPENLMVVSSNTEHKRIHGQYVQVPCGNCGTIIERTKTRLSHISEPFCSRTCMGRKRAAINSISNIKKVAYKCEQCDKPVFKTPNLRSKSKCIFCSKSCAGKYYYHLGDKNEVE